VERGHPAVEPKPGREAPKGTTGGRLPRPWQTHASPRESSVIGASPQWLAQGDSAGTAASGRHELAPVPAHPGLQPAGRRLLPRRLRPHPETSGFNCMQLPQAVPQTWSGSSSTFRAGTRPAPVSLQSPRNRPFQTITQDHQSRGSSGGASARAPELGRTRPYSRAPDTSGAREQASTAGTPDHAGQGLPRVGDSGTEAVFPASAAGLRSGANWRRPCLPCLPPRAP
jgi:hypothetical protein